MIIYVEENLKSYPEKFAWSIENTGFREA